MCTAQSTGVSQSVRETVRDESPSVPSPDRVCSSQSLKDLSQVDGRTPRDTPVLLSTRTSSPPIDCVLTLVPQLWAFVFLHGV